MSESSVLRAGMTLPVPPLERRTAPRYRCTTLLPCRVAAVAIGPVGAAEVQNLSTGGLGLLLPCAVDIGAMLTIKLDGPAAEKMGPLEARVIHGQPADDGRWLAGCILTRSPGPEFEEFLAAIENGDSSATVLPRMPENTRSRPRSSVRLSCNLVALCHWDENGAKGSCSVRVRNISHGGLSLVFSSEPALVQFFTLDLLNPHRSASCSVKARVLYKVEQPGGGYIVGASFPDKLDPRTLRALLS